MCCLSGGRVYINDYWRNCPFKVIPDYRADENNYTITDLEVDSPSARLSVYLSFLRMRCTQLQCTAHGSLVGDLDFERLALLLSSFRQGKLVGVRV
jgi:hypothetical protein